MKQTETIVALGEDQRAIVTDLLSQAITGELIGMSNFAALAGTH
jgi:hypothetical protein